MKKDVPKFNSLKDFLYHCSLTPDEKDEKVK